MYFRKQNFAKSSDSCRRYFKLLVILKAFVLPAIVLLAIVLPPSRTNSSGIEIIVPPAAAPTPTSTPAQKSDSPIQARTEAARIKIALRETRDIPLETAATSVIIVSPEIASAQIKNGLTLTITALQIGETMLIVSNNQRRYTFLVEVTGKKNDFEKQNIKSDEDPQNERSTLSGSYSVSYANGFGENPSLVRQKFEFQQKLPGKRTLRASGEVFRFLGNNSQEQAIAKTRDFGLDRLSLGVDTAEETIDVLDSQINSSPLSFNNYTMRGVHVVSTPNSNLRGAEFFAGLARPSLSFFDNDQGRLAGAIAPVMQTKLWRVRAGIFTVLPKQDNKFGSGGMVLQVSGTYAPNKTVNVEGEAAYSNGGISWRGRLDVQRKTFKAFGEILRMDKNSPFISVGAQPGARKTEAFGLQWQLTARFNASFNYNHTGILAPANARIAAFERSTLSANLGYSFSRNSRLGFRFIEQKLESRFSGAGSRFQIETLTATINYHNRFNRNWSNTFEARLNFSRESQAKAEMERGIILNEQLRFSWKGGSASGFVNYAHKSPSLASLIVRSPQLLPPLLQNAFISDPAQFLQTNRDRIRFLLPGIELPQTRNLDAGLRLQAAFSRYSLASEIRYSTGEISAQNQKNLLASFGVSARLDAANSIQVNGWRSIVSNGGSNSSSVVVSYTHRFGASGGKGFQFSKLFEAGRGRIQGRVYLDLNGNGQDEANEPGVAGMTVHLNANRSATTDEKGRYNFSDLHAGEYDVALFSNDLGVRLRATTATGQRTLISSRQTANLSFGVSNLGSIGGRIFNDVFLTNVQSVMSMPGIGGVRLMLRSSEESGLVIVQSSSSSGNYEFRNVRPGKYTLEIDSSTLPPNFRSPEQTSWSINVEPLQGFYLDIPLLAQRAISGVVFIDKDGDGQFDPQNDEPVEAALVTANGATTISDHNGAYLLRNLPAGNIKLQAVSQQDVVSLPLFIELDAEPVTRRAVNLIIQP